MPRRERYPLGRRARLELDGCRHDRRRSHWVSLAGSTGPRIMCATRRLKSNGGERPSSPGRRSDWVEAEGSLIREMLGRVGAALTTPGRVGTARRCGSGQRDEKAYARNQCLTPLNGPPAQIWRIWAGRGAYPTPLCGVGELLVTM